MKLRKKRKEEKLLIIIKEKLFDSKSQKCVIEQKAKSHSGDELFSFGIRNVSLKR